MPAVLTSCGATTVTTNRSFQEIHSSECIGIAPEVGGFVVLDVEFIISPPSPFGINPFTDQRASPGLAYEFWTSEE